MQNFVASLWNDAGNWILIHESRFKTPDNVRSSIKVGF